MLLLDLFELALIFLIVLGVITQVIIPVKRGTPLFPILREKKNLDEELAEATESVQEELVKKEITRTKKRAATVAGNKPAAKPDDEPQTLPKQ